MWHDTPERFTGDIPATAKWASPELKSLLTDLELRVAEHYDIKVPLTRDEYMWLSCIDKLELLLWANEQKVRGDNRFEDMRQKIVKWFTEREVPVQINRILETYNPTARLRDGIPARRPS
jgi:5'-deoxynucleotidase YfbR-like HD superfamily hydrolase